MAPRRNSTLTYTTESENSSSEDEKPIERKLMRQWLIDQVKSGTIHGLLFLDEQETLIKIPWMHASRHSWSVNQSKLFQAWALHTGRLCSNNGDPKRWKANFRAAINSLPDVHEMKDMHKKGKEAYKVYRLSPARRRESIPFTNIRRSSNSSVRHKRLCKPDKQSRATRTKESLKKKMSTRKQQNCPSPTYAEEQKPNFMENGSSTPYSHSYPSPPNSDRSNSPIYFQPQPNGTTQQNCTSPPDLQIRPSHVCSQDDTSYQYQPSPTYSQMYTSDTYSQNSYNTYSQAQPSSTVLNELASVSSSSVVTQVSAQSLTSFNADTNKRGSNIVIPVTVELMNDSNSSQHAVDTDLINILMECTQNNSSEDISVMDESILEQVWNKLNLDSSLTDPQLNGINFHLMQTV